MSGRNIPQVRPAGSRRLGLLSDLSTSFSSKTVFSPGDRACTSSDAPALIAGAKIRIPALPHDHIPRPQLTSVIDDARRGKIVLLNAPAGYGKTRLLAEWVHGQDDNTAWVSLDADDNDDYRLWTGIISALRACPSVTPCSQLNKISHQDYSSRNASFLAVVADSLAALDSTVNLVLDNVHELVSVEALRGLLALVRDWPSMHRLVLAARVEPPLHLSRLRLAGQLVELRSQALSFSLEETQAMLTLAGLPVGDNNAAMLLKQAGGWPACLQLKAQALAHGQRAGTRELGQNDVIEFTGDYFDTEVLPDLPSDVRHLLDACSICERLPVDLAVALSGRKDAAKLLNWIANRAQLIVPATGGDGAFLANPFLQAHLEEALARERPDYVTELHLRASQWYDGIGHAGSAVKHAMRADNEDWTADLLVRAAPSLLADGQDAKVKATLDKLPEQRVASDPWLTLSAAMACLGTGQLHEADVHIARANEYTDLSSDLTRFRALVRLRHAWLGDRDMREALQDIQLYLPDQAAPGLTTGPGRAISLIHDSLAIISARLPSAMRDSDIAICGQTVRSEDDLHRAAHGLSSLAYKAAASGNVGHTLALIEQIDGLPIPEQSRPLEERALVAVMRSYGALMRAQPGECLRLVSIASKLENGLVTPVMSSSIKIIQAAAQFDSGERHKGFEALRSTRRALGRHLAMMESVALVTVSEYRAAHLLGRTDCARETLEWAEERLGSVGEVMLMRANSSARISRHTAARNYLAPLLDGSVPPILSYTLGEGWLLQCEIALHSGNQNGAGQALEHALANFADTGVLRPMVTAPDNVMDLLIRRLGSLGPLEGFAREVLAVRVEYSNAAPIVLTERERDILVMLPTQQGLEEIARHNNISINTVKSHVKAIYAKLDVNCRRAAVAAAYRSGLIASEA